MSVTTAPTLQSASTADSSHTPASGSTLDAQRTIGFNKRHVRIALIGFVMHDATLMLSMLKLLRTRLRHEWQLVPPEDVYDCVLLGSETTLQDESALLPNVPILRTKVYSHATQHTQAVLDWPPRASRVEETLNAIGERIVANRTDTVTKTTRLSRMLGSASPTLPNTSQTAEGAETGDPLSDLHAVYKLLRWPSQALLRRDPNYLRLASAMVFRPRTRFELESTTLVPAAVIADFLRAVLSDGTASASKAAPQISVDASFNSNQKSNAANESMSGVGRRGLFSRIRQRLGI